MDKTTQSKSKSTVKHLFLALFIVAFLALGVLIGSGLSQTQSSGADLEMKPATDFTVPLYSGGTGDFTLSEHLGQPILLNFWGSWCPPCRAEFPAIQAVADAHKELVVIGVAVQDTEENARVFLIEQGPSFLTGPDLTGSISIDYVVTSMPTTYFITRDGKIFRKWEGLIDEKRLNAFVDELVNM